MATVRPFKAFMPELGHEDKIAALPYDVYNRKEAVEAVKDNPESFLRIDRAETNFPDDVDTYDDRVYDKADELIKEFIAKGLFVESVKPCYYVYELIMDGRSQTGFVGCASVAEYQNGIIKKHENTLAAKEADRINHIDRTNMQTGPIFLAFKSDNEVDAYLADVKTRKPYYDFVSDDGIGHRVWIIDSAEEISSIATFFEKMDALYIADGHHRCASACRVGSERHTEGKDKESDYFLSVLFPDSCLKIMDYNRVIKDLNGLSADEFLSKLGEFFDIENSNGAVRPDSKGQCGMLIDDKWYKLTFKSEYLNDDPVDGLDVSLLQKYVLDGILGIKDPKTDKRIDFVGGIRGLKELERRCSTDCVLAFAMYPTDISELMAVADAGRLMPPKSTWFEPKLRSGLFLHYIGD